MNRLERVEHETDTEVNEFGYPQEYWDQLPDEAQERIIAEAHAAIAVEVDPDDYLPLPLTQMTRGQDLARRSALRHSLDNINEANKRLGLHAITPANPSYKTIDEEYGIEGARKRGEQFDISAKEDLLRACGNCALIDCGLRNDYKRFEKKYHKSSDRKKLVAKLNQDPTHPC